MPLLNGLEKSEYIDSRLEAFEATWAEQKKLIEVFFYTRGFDSMPNIEFDALQAVLDEINASTVDNVTHFLASINPTQ